MHLVLPEWTVFTSFLLIPRYSAGYIASAHEGRPFAAEEAPWVGERRRASTGGSADPMNNGCRRPRDCVVFKRRNCAGIDLIPATSATNLPRAPVVIQEMWFSKSQIFDTKSCCVSHCTSAAQFGRASSVHALFAVWRRLVASRQQRERQTRACGQQHRAPRMAFHQIICPHRLATAIEHGQRGNPRSGRLRTGQLAAQIQCGAQRRHPFARLRRQVLRALSASFNRRARTFRHY